MFDWQGREERKNEYISGELIWGNDFSLEEITAWFEDEKEGYANFVGDVDFREESYAYEPVAKRYLYKYLKSPHYKKVLVFGGGYGTEILPIINQLGDVSILEPSKRFWRDEISRKEVKYIMPSVSGDMDFDGGEFDLIICMGALHHVPNISHIVDEFSRVTKMGGVCVIREPITSMRVFDGTPRQATKRERGVPLEAFRRLIGDAGWTIQKESLYAFGPLMKLHMASWLRYSPLIMSVDDILCRMFERNYVYDTRNIVKKMRPTTGCWVLKKESKNKD